MRAKLCCVLSMLMLLAEARLMGCCVGEATQGRAGQESRAYSIWSPARSNPAGWCSRLPQSPIPQAPPLPQPSSMEVCQACILLIMHVLNYAQHRKINCFASTKISLNIFRAFCTLGLVVALGGGELLAHTSADACTHNCLVANQSITSFYTACAHWQQLKFA